MTDDIVDGIKQNVIQGRMDKEDEGFNGEMLGQPGVKELVQQALDEGVDPSRIVVGGLTEAMKIVGEKFEAKEYFIPICWPQPRRWEKPWTFWLLIWLDPVWPLRGRY
jgi:hypothetical protein